MRTTGNARFGSNWSLFAGSLLCAHAVVGCSPSDTGAIATGGTSTGGSAASTGGTTGGTTGGSVATGGLPATGGNPSTGGSAQTGGATNTGGVTNTGGTSGGSPASGGSAGRGGGGSNSGGMAGSSSGGSATGGSATGGGGSATGGGGSATGGGGSATGGGGSSGGTGGKAPANPSSGCGKTNPQTGTSGSPLMVSNHQYYVKLPTGYDANKPYPTLIIFNPTGNPITWAEQSAGYESLSAKSEAIRVYPHPQNSGSGWGAGDVAFFKPLYDQITGAYCIDKARVFAGGESSGGDFSSIIGCEHANLLRAIAPCATKDVSQYPLDASKRKCTGQVTAVIIHGKNDNVVGPANGPKTRDFYAAVNHCGTMTQPVSGYTDTLSNCVQYQGCDAGYPVYWCQHTDPNYGNTNHGWPAFAAKMSWGVFSSY